MKLTALPVALSCLLVGCQMPAPAQPVDTTNIRAASLQSQSIQQQNQALYMNGALNGTTGRLPSAITANSDRISLDWEGDAIELLAQLARQRGLNFGYTGVRLPLPVSVHVSNITFENLLRQLETQIGWRATLKQQPLELHLYFALPDKGGRLA